MIKNNSTALLYMKSRSPPKITSDKLVFIKTQMKNEVANFTNYGKRLEKDVYIIILFNF